MSCNAVIRQVASPERNFFNIKRNGVRKFFDFHLGSFSHSDTLAAHAQRTDFFLRTMTDNFVLMIISYSLEPIVEFVHSVGTASV
jgi:hypothetical protein